MTTTELRPQTTADRIRAMVPALPDTWIQPTAEHPDQRPCPAWCDKGNGHMAEACHTLQHYVEEDENGQDLPTTNVRATLYPADEPSVVNLSRVETRLEQLGYGLPRVIVSLRTYRWEPGEGHVSHYLPELLKLTVEEAENLASVLTFYAAASRMEPQA
jgi:hypothetical protein